MLSDLNDLLVVVCETVPMLVEEDACVRQQFEALGATLRPGAEDFDSQALVRARTLLRRTSEQHQRMMKLRRDSLQMMKTMIAQCVEWLSTLTESSDQLSQKLHV